MADDNQYSDCINLTFAIEKDDPYHKLKTELLRGANHARMYEVKANNDIFTQMISFLRFVVYTDSDAILKQKVEQTVKTLNRGDFNGEVTSSISMNNEMEVLKNLMQTLERRKSVYDTDLD